MKTVLSFVPPVNQGKEQLRTLLAKLAVAYFINDNTGRGMRLLKIVALHQPFGDRREITTYQFDVRRVMKLILYFTFFPIAACWMA